MKKLKYLSLIVVILTIVIYLIWTRCSEKSAIQKGQAKFDSIKKVEEAESLAQLKKINTEKAEKEKKMQEALAIIQATPAYKDSVKKAEILIEKQKKQQELEVQKQKKLAEVEKNKFNKFLIKWSKKILKENVEFMCKYECSETVITFILCAEGSKSLKTNKEMWIPILTNKFNEDARKEMGDILWKYPVRINMIGSSSTP